MGNRVWVCAAFALLASCATQEKRQEAQLAELLDWYPGRYGSGTLQLDIVRVYAPLIGDFAFYEQQTTLQEPRRIVSQRVVAFDKSKDGVVQTMWSLTEPARWRDAYLNTDVFKGLQSQDFARMPGCELKWTFKEGKFTGVGNTQSCRSTSPATGGTIYVNLSAQLTQQELAIADQAYDVAGRLVQGRAQDPYVHFRRF